MVRDAVWRRLLMMGAACMFGVIAIVSAFVIPRVKADSFVHATPSGAVAAFWVSALADFVVAIALYGAASASEAGRVSRKVVLVTAGLMALVLGLALLDAAAAFTHHGPEMRIVVYALLACAVADMAVGVLALVAARAQRAAPPAEDAGDEDADDEDTADV